MRNHNIHRVLAGLSLLALLLAVPRPASAYVDPGSGAMVWQILAAMGLGLVFYLRRAGEWLSRTFQSKPDQQPDAKRASDLEESGAAEAKVGVLQ